MTMPPRIYLDTNAFIFAMEQTDEKSERMNDLFARSALFVQPVLVTSELTLAELIVKPHRDGDVDLIERYDRLIRPSDWLSVMEVDRAVLWRAGTLRAQGKLKLPDALHLSTAYTAGCSHFLTADIGLHSFSISYSIRSEGRHVPVVSMIRPDIPTLTTLLESLSP